MQFKWVFIALRLQLLIHHIRNIRLKIDSPPLQTCPPETSLCIPFHLCGDGKLPDNQLDLTNSNKSCLYTHKCCQFGDIRDDLVPTMPPFPEEDPTSLQNDSVSSERPRCGVRNKNGLTFRITNARDNEAEFAEFPWMVALFEETDLLGQKSNVYKCGGSLIHPRVVLTATHCVNKKRSILARAGEWDTQNEHEIVPAQNRKVSEIVLHEQFNRGGLFNDIALLILETPFDMADNLGFVCLPKRHMIMNFDSATCTASGWGSHSTGGTEQTILKKVDLPIVPRDKCQDLFRTLRKTQEYELHETYLCAGGLEGKDTCKGDGGSPLVCPISGSETQYVQAGIVSWGRGCGNVQVPGVYANVGVLRGWIDSKMSERKLETFYYDSY